MFTGKNKEQFEKWGVSEKGYTLVNREYLAVYMDKDRSLGSLVYWTDLPQEMKNGILLEYLDSVGYVVEIYFSPTLHLMDEILMHKVFDWNIMIEDDYYSDDVYFYSRQEALTEAFKKADELINKI